MRFVGKLVVPALALGAALAFGTVGPASADVIDYDLNVDGCSTTCGLADYGTVEVTDLSGGGVHVSVTLADNVNFLVDALFFSIAGGPNLTLSGFTTPFGPGDVTGNAVPDNFTIGSFGFFDYTVLCTAWNATTNPTGCGPGASNSNHGPLNFDITNTSVTTASFIDGLGPPHGTGADTGIFFVVDIASLLPGGTKTGRVGAQEGITTQCLPGIDCVNVPEPTSLSLFGAALAGAAVLRRRRRKAA